MASYLHSIAHSLRRSLQCLILVGMVAFQAGKIMAAPKQSAREEVANPIQTASKEPGKTPSFDSQVHPKLVFAPLDFVAAKGTPLTGSLDFFDLFKPGAPWATAAGHTKIFKLYGGFLIAATDDQIKEVVDGLNRLGIAIAMELGPLVTPANCPPLEGFNGPELGKRLALRVQVAGGQLRYVQMDEPFFYANLYWGNPCRWTFEQVAQGVVDFTKAIQEVFPDVVVGDIEPLLGGTAGVASYMQWLDGFHSFTGKNLPFFVLDMDWSASDWPEAAKQLEDYCHKNGTEFGMIYNGNFSDVSDEVWLRHAEQRFVRYEGQYGGRPDIVVLQSWHDHPYYVLPETDSSKFTNLINRYFGNRTVLSSQLTVPSPFSPGRVSGKLVDQEGAPVKNVPIELNLHPLNGSGELKKYSLSGIVPDGTSKAIVGFRVNTETGCSAPSEFTLYQSNYTEGTETINRVPNSNFSSGWEGWSFWGSGNASLHASDQGIGQMLHVTATDSQSAAINSASFPVTAGSAYHLDFSARVGTVAGCNYFAVFFLGSALEGRRDTIPLGPESISLGTAYTNSAGQYDFSLSQQSLSPLSYLFESVFVGDDQNWPASSWLKWAPSTQTNCTYTLSENQIFLPGERGGGDVSIGCGSGCQWGVTSDSEWIDITDISSGDGPGKIHFIVAANPTAAVRTGTIRIGVQTFKVTQAGKASTFSIKSVTPNSGPVTGGSPITIDGEGFQDGLSVAIGGFTAAVSSVTSNQIKAVTGIATAPGIYDVVISNPGGQSAVLSKGFTYTVVTGFETEEVFVPIVLSSSGMNRSFYTSEMTLTNRGTGNAILNFTYSAALGSGSGTGMDTLASGQQKIVPDAISYLRGLGVPIDSSGNQGGTLRVTFSGLASPAEGSVTVRTTTVVPEGRAGLAYAGIPVAMTLTGASYICGLRQNQTDRSNVALQNAGTAKVGNITLQLTVFSGEEGVLVSKVLPDQVLAPGGFVQISGILTSNGLSLSNGYVRVERISGTAPYYAYGVINDQANSDGSFILSIEETAMAGKTRMTLPVVVESGPFTSELVVTNWSTARKTLSCRFVSDNLTTPNLTASFTVEANPFQQLIWPELVQKLRDSQFTGIGAKRLTYAGALLISVATGDLSGISVAARTSAAGGGGRYGLYYTAMAEGTTTTNTAWLYGLQQNDENRTNLALVNTGETDDSTDVFDIELFDGSTAAKVNTVRDVVLNAKRWFQIGSILASNAPNVAQGYAHVIRTSGNNPFIAYAVINDGGQPGERTGDGAFIARAP